MSWLRNVAKEMTEILKVKATDESLEEIVQILRSVYEVGYEVGLEKGYAEG